MSITIIGDNFDREKYNRLATHPMQCWQWGEARKKMGIEVMRLSDGKHVYQLTFHRIPYINLKIGYLPRSTMPTKEVLEFLNSYGKKRRVIFIKIEPYQQFNNITRQSKNMFESPHPLFPEWTIVLDLTKSEDELLKQMKPKTRYNIRLAQKKGVTIREMSDDTGYKIFEKLYFDTCRRQKYHGHTPRYHRIIWDSMKNGIAHILIAFYNETPLAAYELFYFNKTFYYPYGGTSLEYRNLMGANLLMWEAIRLGKKMGAYKFDMWGSLAPGYDQSHDWAGFTHFKEGYNGKFTQMIGSYDLIINPFAYKLYNFAYWVRRQLIFSS